ncbi:hypothetical protein ACTMS2_17120 [Micromonospora sp. SD12]|uniref:hypothetical protein n=1 Tax=Micromonospora sp. SD12 TaxID=3452216 RepID=UPI003F887620
MQDRIAAGVGAAYLLLVGMPFVVAVGFAVASRSEKKRADAHKVAVKLAVMLMLAHGAVSTL